MTGRKGVPLGVVIHPKGRQVQDPAMTIAATDPGTTATVATISTGGS